MGFYGAECAQMWVETDDDFIDAAEKLAIDRDGIEWLSVHFPQNCCSHGALEFTGRTFSSLAKFRRLEGLDLHVNIENDGLAQIARHAPQLKELEFFWQRKLTEKGFGALAALTELESLNLCHVLVGNETLGVVAGLTKLKRFTALFSRDATRKGFYSLEALKELEELYIAIGGTLDDGDFNILREMRKLRKLHIGRQDSLSVECLSYLADLPELEFLDISTSKIQHADLTKFWERHSARHGA